MLSQKIISFIYNLPHFQHDEIDDQYVAVRLSDGTIYLLPQEPEAQEQGLITVRWQGDVNRQTTTIGTQLARLEIVQAVNFWIATGEVKDTPQDAVKFFFEHFKYKTGERLCGIGEEEPVLLKILGYLVKELGPAVIKKAIGL